MLQALLAYLLAACGESKEAVIPAAELLARFPSVPAEELEEHLSLLNLVNFGGGCYTIYAELVDDEVHVDKELWGDTFRLAPRLTPLEARAIRLALEYVGPMIAADAHTQLRGVRRKLEETFGQFELAQLPQPQIERAEEDLVTTLARGMRENKLVEIEYQKEVDVASVDAPRRAVLARAPDAELVRAHVGPHERRRALVPARPDAQREAHAREVRAARGLRADDGCAERGARGFSTRR